MTNDQVIEERHTGVGSLRLGQRALAEGEIIEVRLEDEWVRGTVERRRKQWRIVLGNGKSLRAVALLAQRVKAKPRDPEGRRSTLK